jgi:DNA-binding GntR family transcriptional regulator
LKNSSRTRNRSDDDEVVARANDTHFGLTGSKWGRDRERVLRIAERLEIGTVSHGRSSRYGWRGRRAGAHFRIRKFGRMDFGSRRTEEDSERLVVTPLRETVANAIRRWIFLGTLRPGQVLTQDEVAQRLGISRMPVREAFQLLARDGLLAIEAHRRAVVRALDGDEVIDHYEVRALIESEAAALAARSPDAAEGITAAHALGVGAARAGDAAAYRMATESFHRAIWASAHRPRLHSLAEQLWTGLPPHLPELLPEQLAGSVDEHTALLRAIVAGNAVAARKLMKTHILNSMHRFLSRYQDDARAKAPLAPAPPRRKR